MATKAYIIPVRNDLPAGQVQINDLTPNTSQRNPIVDGPGQTGYVQTGRFLSTAFPGASAAVAFADVVSYTVIGTAEQGLAAYLRVVVHADSGVANDNLTAAEAFEAASLIVQDVLDGTDIDAARLAVHLTAAVGAATEAIGDTDIIATSESFGTVDQVMRILAGEIYEVRADTAIGLDTLGEWQSVAERDVWIATELAASGDVYNSDGGFLTAADPTADTQTWPASESYQSARALYISGSLRASIGEGKLSSLASADFAAVTNRLTVNEDNAGFPTVEYTYGTDDLSSSDYTYSAGSVLAVTPMPVLTVASITAATPAVVTTDDTSGIANADFVWISNHDGTVAVDGPFKVASVSGATFELNTAADVAVAFTVAATTGNVILTNSDGDHAYNLASNSARAIRVYDDEGTNLA
jgi:hypothetical protein